MMEESPVREGYSLLSLLREEIYSKTCVHNARLVYSQDGPNMQHNSHSVLLNLLSKRYRFCTLLIQHLGFR